MGNIRVGVGHSSVREWTSPVWWGVWLGVLDGEPRISGAISSQQFCQKSIRRVREAPGGGGPGCGL